MAIEGIIKVFPLGSLAFSDSFGFFNKVLLSGVYDLKFSASGYLDTTVQNVVVSDTGATQISISLVPNPKNFAFQIVSCFFC